MWEWAREICGRGCGAKHGKDETRAAGHSCPWSCSPPISAHTSPLQTHLPGHGIPTHSTHLHTRFQGPRLHEGKTSYLEGITTLTSSCMPCPGLLCAHTALSTLQTTHSSPHLDSHASVLNPLNLKFQLHRWLPSSPPALVSVRPLTWRTQSPSPPAQACSVLTYPKACSLPAHPYLLDHPAIPFPTWHPQP